jgi:S-adenosylmethionine:tRNA ribosyltransferase-isomerase
VSAAPGFRLPPALEAARPPEERGLARDAVRLMVARHGAPLAHGRMTALPRFLRPGDLLVVNESATIPAALEVVREDGDRVQLHLSTPDPAAEAGVERWIAELRRDGHRVEDARAGERLALPGGARATLLEPAGGVRLWTTALDLRGGPLPAYLAVHGAPIRYAHDPRKRPLAAYQTIFARVPGSAEMPSAGRPFTPRLLQALAARGVGVARLTLHTGVSSLETGEPPYPERFAVPAGTAARVNATRRAGGRVIAVGTTVTRALESAAGADGTVRATAGWTSLVITPERGVRAVDGLVTGWHEPEASHLLMLEAVAGRPLVERSYAAALALGYRWHEFGDAHLLLR